MTYLVKKSLVAPLTQAEVEARIAADLPLRTEAEHVVQSAPFYAPLMAEYLFRAWSAKADVRAGRARVRIVEIPDHGKAVNR